MKIRVLDRILVAIAGLLMIGACAGLVGQVFFGKDVIGFATKQLNSESVMAKVIIGICAALLLVLGIYCLLMLFRHRRKRDKFILQKMETGELAISLDTLETMVKKCLDQHSEIKTETIRLENQREGLLIQIRGIIAGGISIPLTVDTLQKQIKQYVTACSGVEVKGIRIQVESSGEDAKDALFAIEAPTSSLLPKGNEQSTETSDGVKAAPDDEQEKVEMNESPVGQELNQMTEANAAAAAIAAAENLKNEIDLNDDRPIHQRLFSTQEEPCIMPLPPEGLAADENEKAEAFVSNNPENGGEEENQDKPAETDEERFSADDTINTENDEIKKNEMDADEGMKLDEK